MMAELRNLKVLVRVMGQDRGAMDTCCGEPVRKCAVAYVVRIRPACDDGGSTVYTGVVQGVLGCFKRLAAGGYNGC